MTGGREREVGTLREAIDSWDGDALVTRQHADSLEAHLRAALGTEHGLRVVGDAGEYVQQTRTAGDADTLAVVMDAQDGVRHAHPCTREVTVWSDRERVPGAVQRRG